MGRAGPVRAERVKDEDAPVSGGVFCRFRGAFSSLHCSQPEKTKKNKVQVLARRTDDKWPMNSNRLTSFSILHEQYARAMRRDFFLSM